MFLLPVPRAQAKPIKLTVDGTNIFARVRGDSQALVYGMNVAATDAVAMVLPLPTPPDVAEDAVRFIDLSGYPKLFVDLNECFPPILPPASRGGFGQAGGVAVERTLKVHDAGDFEASFVPSIDDVDRIDPRFRLPPGIWEALPQYRDWSFAVFQLRDVVTPAKGFRRWFGGGPRPKTIHPMAFEFPRRFTDRLFFPTVHLHEQQLHERDAFDHALFWQLDPGTRGEFWSESPTHIGTLHTPETASVHVNIAATQGLVAGDQTVSRVELRGEYANQDHWVRTAPKADRS